MCTRHTLFPLVTPYCSFPASASKSGQTSQLKDERCKRRGGIKTKTIDVTQEEDQMKAKIWSIFFPLFFVFVWNIKIYICKLVKHRLCNTYIF